jgi:CheY-like chemotaxis protein
MDGYAATRKIREWEVEKMRRWEGEKKSKIHNLKSEIDEPSTLSTQHSALPIIAMTAHAMSGDEQKSIEAGMNDHVTKPIDPDQLFATLQKWIKPVAGRAADPKSLPASEEPLIPDAAPKPDQAVPEKDGLPESLPGFDLVTGLARLMGNKRLYRKLLLDFGDKYVGVAVEIKEALAVNNFDKVHSLVHNLKGMAGNLEATDLQAAAVEMEKLVKRQSEETVPEEDLKEKFTELNDTLEQALGAVQTLESPAKEKLTAPSMERSAEVSLELAKEVVDRINSAADMGDVAKLKSIAEELKSEADVLAPFCDELIRLAEDFDFDGIQTLCSS